MRVAFVYTTDDYVTQAKPIKNLGIVPFGITYLSAVLKKAGHVTRLLVVTPDARLDETVGAFLLDFRPQVIALTAVASQYLYVREAAASFKRLAPSLPVILGGHHASLRPDVCIADPSIDAICISEGERALLRYVSSLETTPGGVPTGIPNLWIKQMDGSIEKNPPETFNVDLDEIPFPDREMWEPWVLAPENRPALLISRGCPYLCTYCANHAMAGLAGGKYTRYRSPASIVAEVQELVARYPAVTEIFLEAETFGADLKMTFPICEALAEFNRTRDVPIQFGANFTLIKRISDNVQLLEALQRANFTWMNIGFESGSERLRNGYLQRPPYRNEDVIHFVEKARGHGIDVIFFVLMGLPTETVGDFHETIQVCRDAQPYDVFLSIFYPYPGTKLFDVAMTMGLISSDQRYGYERSRPNLELPEFPTKRLLHEYVWFFYKVYGGRRPFPRVMLKVLRQYVLTKPRLNAAFNRLVNSRLFVGLNRRARFQRANAHLRQGGARPRLDSALG
jgi:anaerobic magnesium-protoporphyrin IX monomethyl ester cyclase